MGRYGLTLSDARNLQRWALEVSGAKKFLDTIPKIPKTKKIKPGLYVSYEIDENELDDGIDYAAPCIASIIAIDNDGNQVYIGLIRAYNWESYWLEVGEDEQVDTAENWWGLILKEYEGIKSREELMDNAYEEQS